MKATQPVTVNGIAFDALISENRDFAATVPQYPVEEGYSVSDSIILSSEALSMVLMITDTPVTWLRQNGSGPGRCEQMCSELEDLYYQHTPLTIVTSAKVYEDMAIESMSIGKSAENGYSREVSLSLKKIRKTVAKTTTIPDSYGKSGATGAAAGTASTGSGSTGSGSNSASGGGSGSGSKSSILYGMASNAGLFSQ